ncbi:hypothetical protein HMPREF1861_02317 [Corynebacterium kroppenstedtii]|nr:hypothetical protein HMPREF1861_02317 [Corynebacterium kroppenstedtii]
MQPGGFCRCWPVFLPGSPEGSFLPAGLFSRFSPAGSSVSIRHTF